MALYLPFRSTVEIRFRSQGNSAEWDGERCGGPGGGSIWEPWGQSKAGRKALWVFCSGFLERISGVWREFLLQLWGVGWQLAGLLTDKGIERKFRASIWCRVGGYEQNREITQNE